MRNLLLMLAIVSLALVFQAPMPAAAQAGPDKAEVIFHRPDKMAGKATRFNLQQDGRPIGQLLAGTEIVLSLDPGTYTFTASAMSLDGMDQLTLTVEAGKTYTVTGEVVVGWPVARPKFTNVSESGVATPPVAPQPSPPPAAQPATAASAPVSGIEAARLGLKNLVGDWSMEMWSLTSDGRKLKGAGTVEGVAVGDYAVNLTISQFAAPEMPNAKGGGTIQIALHPERGLSLTSKLRATDEELRLSGQYQAGNFVFYLVGGGPETISGAQRSSFRTEFKPVGEDAWIVETYSSVDGRTAQVQSASLTRR